MSFRNRCVIAAANGPVNLTVPIAGGRNQRTLMKDVRILNSEKWQVNHWRTITSAYNRSPWFEHFRDGLEILYSTPHEYLWEWNISCFAWVCDKLSIAPVVSFTSEYRKEYDDVGFEDWRNKLRPNSIAQWAAESPRYTQVFSNRYPFIPNLSVLDFLFCSGPLNLNNSRP